MSDRRPPVAMGRRFTFTGLKSLRDLDAALSGSTDLSGDQKEPVQHIRVNDKVVIEEQYTLGNKLGQGAFGTVRLIHDKESGQPFALKSVKKKIGSTASVEQLQREVVIMKKVKHPHIIQLKKVYETPTKVFLVMEYCKGGELVHKIRQRRYCPESDVRIIIQRLVDAIAYLHDHGVVHRDIKPESPTDPYNLKLSDFGLATYSDACEMMDNVCGTPFYMAPEVCSSLPYSQQCDIWSCGIIMYLLLCNYRRECESLLQDMIIQGKIEFPEKYWASISDSAKDLIEHMLRFDPARRCSANEIKEHPWIRGESSAMTGVVPQTTVLELMKSYNAERRFKRAITFIRAAVRFVAAGSRRALGVNNCVSEESIIEAEPLGWESDDRLMELEQSLMAYLNPRSSSAITNGMQRSKSQKLPPLSHNNDFNSPFRSLPRTSPTQCDSPSMTPRKLTDLQDLRETSTSTSNPAFIQTSFQSKSLPRRLPAGPQPSLLPSPYTNPIGGGAAGAMSRRHSSIPQQAAPPLSSLAEAAHLSTSTLRRLSHSSSMSQLKYQPPSANLFTRHSSHYQLKIAVTEDKPRPRAYSLATASQKPLQASSSSSGAETKLLNDRKLDLKISFSPSLSVRQNPITRRRSTTSKLP